jgi:hypothetical protein
LQHKKSERLFGFVLEYEGMVAGMGCKTLARAWANASLVVFALSDKISIPASVIAAQF